MKPTDEQLLEGIEVSCENAGQFIKDAETLRQNGSYGHALGLAELAVEEMGRTHMLTLCRFGMLGWEWTDAKLRKHEGKISEFFALQITRRLEEDPTLIEQIKRLFLEAEATSQDSTTGGEFVAHLIRDVIEARLSGFYVDWKEGRWDTPRDISEDMVVEMLEDARRNFDLYRRKYLPAFHLLAFPPSSLLKVRFKPIRDILEGHPLSEETPRYTNSVRGG